VNRVPRFVVLRHDFPDGAGRPLHWDFMLEAGDVLRTWALAEQPGPAGTSCFAQKLADHRLVYLDYEGEISGNRGTVSRLDGGDYAPAEDELIGNDSSAVVVTLNGALLRGPAALVPCGGDDQRWRFSFVPEGTAASGLSCDSAAGDPSDSRGTV
jgi:hypothetical protein